VERLLALVDGRRMAPALVLRLADRGPVEAGRLARFIHEGYVNPSNGPGRGDDVTAALKGLCRLGSSADTALPRLRRLAAERVVPPRMQETDLWRTTLVALGARLDEFDLPPGVRWRTDLYREKLGKNARRGCSE
jgi:hypothetical protein